MIMVSGFRESTNSEPDFRNYEGRVGYHDTAKYACVSIIIFRQENHLLSNPALTNAAYARKSLNGCNSMTIFL